MSVISCNLKSFFESGNHVNVLKIVLTIKIYTIYANFGTFNTPIYTNIVFARRTASFSLLHLTASSIIWSEIEEHIAISIVSLWAIMFQVSPTQMWTLPAQSHAASLALVSSIVTTLDI